MASVTDHGTPGNNDPTSTPSLAEWAQAVDDALDGDDTTVNTRIATATADAANLGSGAATDGQVLTADGLGGAAWSAASGGGAEALDDLTDVATAGAATGEALVYDGAAWGPSSAAAILEGDARLSDDRDPTAHAHTLADVTDARGAAALDVGTTAGTVAAGDDSRIVGAIPASLVDAKGDLIVGTAADTVARLPVGTTTGHVLTVDPAEATGLKFAAAAGGSSGMDSVIGPRADGSKFMAALGSTARAFYAAAGPLGYPMGYPIPLGGKSVEQVGIYVSTGAAGETCSLAVYGSDPTTGLPSGAPLAYNTALSVATTGYKWLTVQQTIPGPAMWAFTVGGTVGGTARAWGMSIAQSIANEWWMGVNTDQSRGICWRIDQDCLTAWPTSPAVSSGGGTYDVPSYAIGYVVEFA